jgi:hypothetical protein
VPYVTNVDPRVRVSIGLCIDLFIGALVGPLSLACLGKRSIASSPSAVRGGHVMVDLKSSLVTLLLVV